MIKTRGGPRVSRHSGGYPTFRRHVFGLNFPLLISDAIAIVPQYASTVKVLDLEAGEFLRTMFF